jgi:hypothetical protein
MLKLRYLLALILLASSVFGLFQVKFKVQQLHREVTELREQVAYEKDTIHVLKAEWSYLNHPERLSRLSKKFLELGEVKSEQVVLDKSKNILHLVSNKDKQEDFETDNLVKVSMKKKKKKAVRWNYRERPAIKTRSKK